MAEKEYIERDKLGIGRCNPEVFEDKGYAKGWNAAIDIIQSAPAADVRPVVRGRWEKCVGENGVTSACRCSLCGFEDNRFSMFNYCPNCGADMREES